MGQVTDIGSRIELVSMDPHFKDITIALYEQEGDGGLPPRFLVQTYSQKEGASTRMDFIAQAMATFGGVDVTSGGGSGPTLTFPCGARHFAAVKRLFLESCKIPSDQTPVAKPLKIFDKKADTEISVVSESNGQYRVTAEELDDKVARRVGAISAGLVKLGEMEAIDDGSSIRFACGHDHDLLIGLLLPRAINVRQAMREQEQSASRGVLAAPSQQE